MSTINSLKVAYNNVYRYLHNVKPPSITGYFVSKNIDSFKVILRKASYSLFNRCFNSDNILVSTIFNSAYLMFHPSLCVIGLIYYFRNISF